MVKLILNKKYKAGNPGDVIEANKKLEERLINKGMAHYAPKLEDTGYLSPPTAFIEEAAEILGVTKVKKPRKPRKKKAEKFKW